MKKIAIASIALVGLLATCVFIREASQPPRDITKNMNKTSAHAVGLIILSAHQVCSQKMKIAVDDANRLGLEGNARKDFIKRRDDEAEAELRNTVVRAGIPPPSLHQTDKN